MWVVLLYDHVGVMALGISSMVYEVTSCDAVFGKNNFSLGSYSGDPVCVQCDDMEEEELSINVFREIEQT
jgi:hypothetical protein